MNEKENLKEKLVKYKEEKKERDKRLSSSFIDLVLHNKLYDICLLITVFFIGSAFYTKVSKEVTNIKVASEVEDKTAETISKEELDDTLDISPYIGIYSNEITLSETININSCNMDSYKIIYRINKDKTLDKYFQSTCIGTIKILSNTLSYYSTGGARYIGIPTKNFIFGTNSMKEIDGNTYKIDDTITKITESTNKNIQVSFINGNILIQIKDNLYYIKGSQINFKITDEYQNLGGSLEQRLYKSQSNNDLYKLIVFSNNEAKSCYNESIDETINYTIYEIRYNSTEDTFTIKELLERTKLDGCTTYEEDLNTLKE